MTQVKATTAAKNWTTNRWRNWWPAINYNRAGFNSALRLSMNAIAKPLTPPELDTWIAADWDAFLQIAEAPSSAKLKSYYHQGRMRFELMSTGSDHSKDHASLIQLLGLYAMVMQLPVNFHDGCSYRKTDVDEFQPDISCYANANANVIPFGTRVIDLDTYPIPNLVIEISDTSLSDDKGEKRIQYEDLRIPEYWIVDVKKCQILGFAISLDGSSQRIQVSRVISGLAFELLESALKRSRQENQSATMAWFMAQMNASQKF
jgi:Uma2 family endonuclease